MKKHEWITLGIGIVIIVIVAFGSGLFTSSKLVKNMNGSSNKIPEVIAKNISTDPKLQILEVSAGTGSTTATTSSKVSVNYTGMLEDGTVFDSSYTRGQPISFVLGTGSVIQGWDRGLQGMKAGGKRRLIISSDYAYGSAGVKNPQTGEVLIPPNATLIFDVEMVSVGK